MKDIAEIILKLNGEEFREGEIVYITFYEIIRHPKTKELMKKKVTGKAKITGFLGNNLSLDMSTECNSEKVVVYFPEIIEIHKKRSHKQYIDSCNRIK